MLQYLMYIFLEQICMFGYLKTPDIMLSIVFSKKMDWTHTFDTHCMSIRLLGTPITDICSGVYELVGPNAFDP